MSELIGYVVMAVCGVLMVIAGVLWFRHIEDYNDRVSRMLFGKVSKGTPAAKFNRNFGAGFFVVSGAVTLASVVVHALRALVK